MSRLESEKEVASANEQLRSMSKDEQYEWLIGKLYQAFAEARKGKLNTVNEQPLKKTVILNSSS